MLPFLFTNLGRKQRNIEKHMNTQESRLFQKVQIGVASPKQIRYWAERFLPDGTLIGEVDSWETVNYKTLKPEPNGLFCQKIFGPVVDFTCACGKKAVKSERDFCPKCGVERTHSRVRRYRLGYIKLKQPVVHPLYSSQRPSPVSLCLNWSTRRMQAVIKTTEFCSLPKKFSRFYFHIDAAALFCPEKGPHHIFFDPSFGKEIPDIPPRLFTAPNKKTPFFIFNLAAPEPRLYGIAYDATWQKVDEFQEVVYYLWEQPFPYECSAVYYAFTKPVKKYKEQIPPHEQSYGIQTGGFVFQHMLAHFDLPSIRQDLEGFSYRMQITREMILRKMATLDPSSFEDRKEYKRLRMKLLRIHTLLQKCRRQQELFRDFQKSALQPAWMVLSTIPVLPPGLRPITSIGGQLVVSDINSLYRKVLIRNKRITRGASFGVFDTALSTTWISWCYNLRQVQEAVDELFKTGSVESGRPLKSLLEGLKGKQGRFRQHILGKRVDYSGRSVIVVGPQLEIHQCGLPKQMAVELFQPFLIQKLRKQKIVFTTTAAKALIAERKPIVWTLLTEILKTHPVLLNRAPTLHRLGIQAFLPKLVEGKAILLHPLVCPAFNADFDGDQMAVHVPLSPQTRAEAFQLLWSRNHLLAPASGQPLLLPTQDMVLGFYYLTCSQDSGTFSPDIHISSYQALLKNEPLWEKKPNLYFSDFSQVKRCYEGGFLTLHTPVWVKWAGAIENSTHQHHSFTRDTPIEVRLDSSGSKEILFSESCCFIKENFQTENGETLSKQVSNSLQKFEKDFKFVRTTTGRVLMHLWIYQS